MPDLMRFGVSIEKSLLQEFDRWVGKHNWANRSEAIRDIIRDHLVVDSWGESQDDVTATLTYVYDHHVTDLQARLTSLQHDHEGSVLSTMHVHLDHHNCIEVLVMKAKASEIQALTDSILGTRGVKHGALVRSIPEAGI
ncbi:MAG: nickel-responsive transcriptional regulator NikR [Deltaproteobacteria bacterium]|nr:nickel-responsive transcriptional regulator NikR [Deltaproteobacteria bacterium]MBW1873080.1 nickel-responsive transcriptional regulator NikR [Deltaproteobacteria bacterium]